MNPAERVVGLFGELLRRRERDRALARTARVLGRHEDGTERIQRTDAVCVTRGAADNHYGGTTILASSLSPYHRAGSALGTSEALSGGALWVERLDPSELRRGDAVEVIVTGRGFDTATWIDFLLPPVEDVLLVNQDLVVQSVTFVDTETLLLGVEVPIGARLFPAAPITFGRQPGATSMSTTGDPRETGRKGFKADAYSVLDSLGVPRYYAFLLPSDLLACIYASDGTWVADRGSLALAGELPTGENANVIIEDANGVVGPGALAWRSGDNELSVWDVEGEVLYTYEGTVAAFCTPPVYHEGWLYWAEFASQEDEPDTGETTHTLRQAHCDLADPQTVETVVFSTEIQSWDVDSFVKIASSNGGLMFSTNCTGNVGSSDGSFHTHARFAFGVGGQEAEMAENHLDLAQGLAAADGYSVGLQIPSNTLRALEPALGAVSVERWPTTDAWALEEFSPANAAVSGDGTLALLYGSGDAELAQIVIEAPSSATSGEPTARVVVANHPVHLIPPDLLFFME